MMRSGMVSVTFRRLTPGEIVRLSADAGLDAIEWGGDVHAPHGDLTCARRVADLTRAAGLQVAGYASYYYAGFSQNQGLRFETVLTTAVELGAPVIRVWAGKLASSQASPEDRRNIGDDLHRIAAQAEKSGIRVAVEYHAGSLTDSPASTLSLLGTEAAHPNLRTYWQSRPNENLDSALQELSSIQPWLENIHVFHWAHQPVERLPLAVGEDRWRRFLEAAGDARHALLEFVPDDDPRNLARDAATLHRLLQYPAPHAPATPDIQSLA